jgi:triphosphatase
VNRLPKDQTSSATPVEVELKFQLLPGAEAILRADPVFGPTATRVQQVTTYHDTRDHLLHAAGLALRIRQEGVHFVQTVKSRDTGDGLASRRKEWEWPVQRGLPDIGKMAQVPELATVAGQIADRLQPIIVTDVWRTRRLVDLADGAVAELALDIGSIVAGALSEPICELKLELKHGPFAPLCGLALRLANSAPMWISVQSKASRGWQLHVGTGDGAATLRKPKIDKRSSAGAGLHQITGTLLGHLAANIAPTLSGDPEGLRQMRGALRQLRTVFMLFRPLLTKGEAAGFTGPLQQFAQTFGKARDWDVFCLQTLPAASVEVPELEWSDLTALALEKRVAAHDAVKATICGAQFTHLLLNLALWAETQVNPPQAKDKSRLSGRLSALAPELLDACAARARQAGRHPTRLSITALHDFRKALDRLNAAIRFLSGTYKSQSISAYHKRINAVRDIIGAANDAQVTKLLAHELGAAQGHDVKTSLHALCAWADRRQAVALAGLKPAARRFRKGPEFWRI